MESRLIIRIHISDRPAGGMEAGVVWGNDSLFYLFRDCSDNIKDNIRSSPITVGYARKLNITSCNESANTLSTSCFSQCLSYAVDKYCTTC